MPAVVNTFQLIGRHISYIAAVRLACAMLALSISHGGSLLRIGATPASHTITAAAGGPYLPASMRSHVHHELAGDLFGHLSLSGHGDALAIPAQRSCNLSEVAAESGTPDLLPVARARITSAFGPRNDPLGRGGAFHSGIDFGGTVGTPIRASGDGVVTQARFHKDYGNVATIDHGNGVETLYAHASHLKVRRGDVVHAGQVIARMGSTGRSTGPHLHFEVRKHGRRVDPAHYLTEV